ncbi:chorismate mutase [Shimazuella sp. AN120528]|uniref:chorismate mutase n=1 Tax=Shimazuella soli TaxID=1892854 RepID=UPI001F0E6600|nr:chorismate mutase [Shimazuella soli]
MVRGIRGATTVSTNTKEEILKATKELSLALIERNDLHADDVASILITSTPDLNAAFPAAAIRSLKGWELVPLMGASEVDVPNGLALCIRMMFLVNTDKSANKIRHVYLNEAVKLRPDLKS